MHEGRRGLAASDVGLSGRKCIDSLRKAPSESGNILYGNVAHHTY
jgi:hypothetical protein